MAGKKKTKKGGKKGGMGYVLALVVALGIMLPASAIRSEAAGFTYGLDDIPTRVTAGLTLSDGLSDPGEAGAIGLNKVFSVINENLTIPGLVVKWGDQRVLELGVLSGGYSGSAGNDAGTEGDKGFAFLGLGAYLLEGVSANVIYVIDSRAESNVMTYASVDVARLGPKLVSLTSAAWSKTGL